MKRFATLFALVCATNLTSFAQMPIPKPAPELKNVDYFAGTWKMEGTMKPGPMGPGGAMTETETNKWMDGNFFLVCNSDFKSSMGDGTGISMIGYDSDKKVYTYDEYNSMGEAEHSTGTLDGSTWTWTSDEHMNGMTMHGRFIIKELSPTSYTFNFDMSQDGTTWNTVMDGKATKVK